jgi:hypothetical protein
MRLLLLTLIVSIAAPAVAVPVTGGPRPAQREVIPSGAGPNRLDLDVESVAATALGIRTLRLHDASGAEVAWLAIPSVPGPEHWSQARSMLAIRETKESSGFEADFGEMAEISAMNLEGLATPLLKRFRLEGSGDRLHWSVLVAEGTLFDLPEDELRRTRVELEPGAWRYLRVTWDDRSSARVGRPRAAWARRVVGAPSEIVLRVPAVVEGRPSEPGVTRVHVRLPGKNLPLRAIELDASQPHVLREAHVTMPALGEDGLRPMPLGEATLRRNERDGVVAADMRLPLVGPFAADSLDVAIDDGDNPPLRDLGATLELGPLPWIYFEAPTEAPLIASFDPDAAEPRYDLEAARAQAESSRPPRARWGAWRVRVEKPALPPAMPLAGAPLDASSYAVARAIPAIEPGLASLLLDADVLARSHDLMDVRIVDEAGRQVPYLSEERDEPLALSLPPLAQWPADATDPGDARHSRYGVDLPRAGLPPSKLVLRTQARVFERTVSVVVMRPPPDPRSKPWRDVIAQATWRSADPDEAAPALALELPRVEATRVMLEIDEGDNAPLPLDAAELLLPHRRVRFAHPGGDALRLLYGNAQSAPPRYDLSLLRSTVMAAPATDIDLAATAAPIAEPPHASTQKLALWAILGGAIVVLLVVLARLVKRDA